MQLLQAKIDRGIQTPFWCESRADNLNEQVLDKLVEANCDTVAIGLESADLGVLRRVAKGIKIDSVSHIVEIARSKIVKIELFSMFGLPGETVESALCTLNFVRRSMIPIQYNSEAQRLNLYFGSIYERYKERFGFKPLSSLYYLPAYLSIGELYESQTLTNVEFLKIQRTWTLASVDMLQNAHNRELVFDVLNFLLESENDLQDEEAFYEYGALAERCS